MINVLNEEILLPADWINYFVIAEWNLQTQKLTVFLEENDGLITLKHIDFKINDYSFGKIKKSVALSYDH